MIGIETDTFLLFGILLALGGGVLSFLSPCVLPIFPAYLSYITGMSVKEIQDGKSNEIRRRLLSHSAFFLLGVSLVFLAGGLSAAFLGHWLADLFKGSSGMLIQRLAGLFIIVMGLFVGGWLNITTLMKEKRVQYKKKSVSYLGTFLVGTGFAAGWTPCIGPIFGSILGLAIAQPAHGVFYTIMFIIGFAIPFLLLTFYIGSTRWILQKSGIIMKVGGIIMIIMGIVLFTGQLPRIAEFLLNLVEDTWFAKYLG